MVYDEFYVNFGGPIAGRPKKARSSTLAREKFVHFKGLSMVLLGAVLWGISGTAAQVLFQRDALHAGWLTSVRMSGAGLMLLAAISLKSGLLRTIAVWQDKRDAARLAVFAIIGLLGVQYSYLASIRYGNAATGTVLQYMGPMFITVYVALRQRRMPTIRQSASVVLALAGAFFLVTNGHWHRLSVSPLAVFWGFVSAVTLAFYSLYPQDLLHKYGSATIVGWAMLIGGVAMGFRAPPWHFLGHSSVLTWGLVGFVVVFGTLIAFYVYIASLKYISAAEAGVLSSGEPLSASIIAVAFLHVHLGVMAMLGGLCVLATVTLLASNRSAG